MHLSVQATLPNPAIKIGGSNRWTRRYNPDGRYAHFQITPYRLIGPPKGTGKGEIIYADAPMPEKYKEFEGCFADLGNGNRRFPIVINHNRKTLAPFLASGMNEMDVREVA